MYEKYNNIGDISRRCIFFNFVTHRVSYAKQLGSKKQLENEKHFRMIIPEWLFQDFIENKPEKIYKPKPFKQLAREHI